jgi:hypothetical protein
MATSESRWRLSTALKLLGDVSLFPFSTDSSLLAPFLSFLCAHSTKDAEGLAWVSDKVIESGLKEIGYVYLLRAFVDVSVWPPRYHASAAPLLPPCCPMLQFCLSSTSLVTMCFLDLCTHSDA